MSPARKIQMMFLCGWNLIYYKWCLCSPVLCLLKIAYSLVLKMEGFYHLCGGMYMQEHKSVEHAEIHLK